MQNTYIPTEKWQDLQIYENLKNIEQAIYYIRRKSLCFLVVEMAFLSRPVLCYLPK